MSDSITVKLPIVPFTIAILVLLTGGGVFATFHRHSHQTINGQADPEAIELVVTGPVGDSPSTDVGEVADASD
ncbi:hypothetical protein GSI_05030 [Ganoderma sinense ZZ0214-1]|uniref:Uncharacterized protein n=1 Tax=Ganoderma sinense ZZ0214-1 TaxID=1077348 RepID=A0A2G8SGN1_9APHY|nr:hypothetical protein GSI_05030 [Ganoderma sinense ZZ0214-1]